MGSGPHKPPLSLSFALIEGKILFRNLSEQINYPGLCQIHLVCYGEWGIFFSYCSRSKAWNYVSF